LVGTDHPQLDGSKNFRARVANNHELELLDGHGDSIDPDSMRLDTSKGRVVIPHFLILAGWPLPIAVWTPILLAVAIASGSQVSVRVAAAAAAASLLLAAALAVPSRRRFWRGTPLERRLHAFHKGLPPPTPCAKGPGRAITLGKLMDLNVFFAEFIRDRDAYYLNANITKRLTKAAKLSYAELVGAANTVWFVSHFWGTAFRHFCESLRKHAEGSVACSNEHWQDVAYWICFCSNNQYQISSELGDGDWRQSSFYLTLRSGLIRGTCMVLDETCLPLTRAWCIFELLQTLLLEEQCSETFVGLLFCTETGVLNTGNASSEVAVNIVSKIAQLDLRNASASVAADKEMINEQVLQQMGSFAKMHDLVRHHTTMILTAACKHAGEEFEKAFRMLRGDGSSRQLPPPGSSDDDELEFSAALDALHSSTLMQELNSGPTVSI